MNFDWTPYLVGGGTRPDAITGLDPRFNSALAQLFQAAPDNIRQNLRVTSGYRSNEVQKGLWENALKKYGDPEIADNWVARPGKSNHNHGGAVDFKFLDPSAQDWVHKNAANFGLKFPMAHEPWHVEMGEGAPNLSFSVGPPPTRLGTMFNPEAGPLDMGAPVGGSLADLFAVREEQQREKEADARQEQQRKIALAELIRY